MKLYHAVQMLYQKSRSTNALLRGTDYNLYRKKDFETLQLTFWTVLTHKNTAQYEYRVIEV